MDFLYTNIGQTIQTDKELIKTAYNSLQWVKLGKGKNSIPFSQGYAINAFIQEFKVPKVTHISYHGGEIPSKDGGYTYQMLSVRGNHLNGTFDVCFVDDGLSLTPTLTVKH